MNRAQRRAQDRRGHAAGPADDLVLIAMGRETRGLSDIRGIEVVGDPEAFTRSLERMRRLVAGSFPPEKIAFARKLTAGAAGTFADRPEQLRALVEALTTTERRRTR